MDERMRGHSVNSEGEREGHHLEARSDPKVGTDSRMEEGEGDTSRVLRQDHRESEV
jgi:hypothetical protein